MSTPEPVIAVLLPCFNEAQTIEAVIAGFRGVLPHAVIHVCDNGSTDNTAEIARALGAIVRREPRRGKGNAMRRMFADIDADIYLMADGDDTYAPEAAPAMIALLRQGPLDLVNGVRAGASAASFRRGHRFGNRMLSALVRWFFGSSSRDMLSGYKVMSRRFVKSFPALSTGFEIETELLVHALELSLPMAEVETTYRPRPEGSRSKLRTFQDGFQILKLITLLVKEERPLLFFSTVAVVLAFLSVGLATPVIIEFLETGLVRRLPTAVLATGLMLSAITAFFSGMILDTVTRGRRELKRLSYLQHKPVW